MGTRCLVTIKRHGLESETLVHIYRQYDGYPSGMGTDIKKILNEGNCRILNGYQYGQESPEFFNGMGCLAAYLISKLKKGIGNVYIDNDNSQEYNYTIYEKSETVHMMVTDWDDKLLYKGSLTGFDGKYIDSCEGENEE